MSSGAGGFSYPVFSLTLDNAEFPEASPPGTLIGNFASTPLDGRIHLIDNAGGKVAMGDNQRSLVVGATEDDTVEAFSVTARLSWAGAFSDFEFTINSDAATLSVGGSTSFVHNAATNTVLGAISSVPSGASYSIVSQDVASGLAISAGNLVKGSGTITAGAYHFTLRATKGSFHWDQAFTYTAT